MKCIDYARSYFTFRIDTLKKPPATASHKPPFTLNNARIPLDCRCRITDSRDGTEYEFVQGGNCKTERVGVERDIWTQPNADFVPVLSRDQFLIIKTFDVAGKEVMLYPPSLGAQPERQTGLVEDAYDDLRIDLAPCDATLLASSEEVVRAVLSNTRLVVQTTLRRDPYVAVIEYPVKTINANERDNVYQTDTGPVLLPDLGRDPDELIGGFELAFVASNAPDWAEFLVRVPTDVGRGLRVYHYSESLRLDVENQILSLPD